MGNPAAMDFGVGCEIGSDAKEFLSAAVGYAKASDDFVEDDERAVAMGDFIDGFEVAGFRHDAVGVGVDGLHDDGSDLPGVSIERGFEEIDVIPLARYDLGRRTWVHAC